MTGSPAVREGAAPSVRVPGPVPRYQRPPPATLTATSTPPRARRRKRRRRRASPREAALPRGARCPAAAGASSAWPATAAVRAAEPAAAIPPGAVRSAATSPGDTAISDRPASSPSTPQARAADTVAGVPGYSLAPQRRWPAVPGGEDTTQFRARRARVEGTYHHAGRLQLRLHPLHLDRGVLRRQFQGLGDLGPGQFAGAFQPPQREHATIVGFEPAGRQRGLPTLAGKLEPRHGQVHEVGAGVREFLRLLHGARSEPPVPPVRPDLVHRDRHEPGAEARRCAQAVQAVQGAEHGVLHDVVDIDGAVQSTPDYVVDQGEKRADQGLLSRRVARSGGSHQCRRLHRVLSPHENFPVLDSERCCRCLGDRPRNLG
jgi:hypothetical protein